MSLGDVLRLSASAALLACAALPALAQTTPLPRPRPPHLTAAPPPAPVAAIPTPATASVAAPSAASAVPVAAAAPSAEAPLTAVAEQPAPAEQTAAVATLPDETAPPLDLTRPSALPQPVDITPAPGAGLAAVNPVDTPSEASTLKKVNTYFNGISTLVGNFTQVGPDGSTAGGKFFLMKPGKVRFYYQRPSTTDIIADGKSLVVRDRKLATQDVYPLSQTPLKFLLDTNLDLARDSKVVAVYEEPGLVSVALEEETTFGGKARVLIVFGTEDQQTYELKQWTITDPQGLDTTVAVSQLDTATRPDDKLFAVDYTRDIKPR